MKKSQISAVKMVSAAATQTVPLLLAKRQPARWTRKVSGELAGSPQFEFARRGASREAGLHQHR
jgi:hypothetical protein